MASSRSRNRDRNDINNVDRQADRAIEDRSGLQFDFDRYRLTVAVDRADRVGGTSDRDYSFGQGGDDRLGGGAEDDFLFGGAGNDILSGDGDTDRMFGGAGNDRIYGGDLGDDLSGEEGDDYLDAGPGHDDLEGGAGNDTLVGGAGSDAFSINPGSGNDVARDFTPGPALFDHIVVRGMTAADLRIAQTANGALITWTVGAGGSLLLQGVNVSQLSRDDFMFTEVEGGDLLPEGREVTAGDFMTSERNASETPPDIGATTTGRRAESFDNLADSNIRRGGLTFDFDDNNVIVGDNGNDNPAGTAARDLFFGQGGNDRFNGGAGEDTLQGGAGDDTLLGEAGQDWLDGGAGADLLFGGDLADTLIGGEGDDLLDAGGGHDMIEGEGGNDTLIGGLGADAFIVDKTSGNDTVLDFSAGPGSFDHIAFLDIRADELIITDTVRGVRIAWDGGEDSILLQGVFARDLVQDDFMFNLGPQFVAGISTQGSELISPEFFG